jgi:hypothetical protein
MDASPRSCESILDTMNAVTPQHRRQNAMAQSLNVGVVGAGMSGLTAIRELLDEGHRVTCFERAPSEGGNFNYPIGAAYDSMNLTVSQYHMAFSCFPPPMGDQRRFWSREEYAKYLHDFGLHFGLFSHIQFNTEVLNIQPDDNNTQFRVTSRDKQTGGVTDTIFDAVAICSGAHAVHIPQMPQFEGSESFSGTIVHAVHYRSPEPFRDKDVVCVGFGETAADVTCQIAEVASSCWTSFRRYPSVIKRYYGPYTHDSYTTRIQGTLPRFVINRLLLQNAQRTLDAPLDETDPGDRLLAEWTLKCGTPSHQPLEKNDDFLKSISNGKLQVKPFGIQRLEEDSVIFTDGSRVKADVLMCCTGYDEGRPPNLIEGAKVSSVRDLYKHAFDPDLGERVAYIGWARPAQGGIPACSEMQSRYFALLCSGERMLPEKEELRQLIAQDRDTEERAFYARRHQATIVSYTPFMDGVAELVGCRPQVRDFLFNPRMVYHLLCGANIPTAYRLRGPHAMPDMAQRVLLSLPIAHSMRELTNLSYLQVLNRLGVFKEPPEVHVYEEALVNS